MRSVKRVAEKVNKRNELGLKAFTTIGYQILNASSKEEVIELFEVLKGRRPLSECFSIH